jgi:DNA-binding transcriptional MerR regulator/DNA gyrase inhibitor GyrI
MIRIGEVANRYGISLRTLRYWEEVGILKSRRTENGYRFYDEQNAARIQQIVIFRALELPIVEIEKIYLNSTGKNALEILKKHYSRLKEDARHAQSLTRFLENLIQQLEITQDFVALLPDLAEQLRQSLTSLMQGPLNPLSERMNTMSQKTLDHVRIVKLPPMTIASYRAESSTPEADCSNVMNAFVLQHELHKKAGFRHFGFNNPSPSEGNPIYGYEIWVAVPDDFEVPAPFEKKLFSGGLYASVPTTLNEIGERWMQLYHWTKNSAEYDVDFSFQWLEECVDVETFLTADDSTKQLDLLEPIRRK